MHMSISSLSSYHTSSIYSPRIAEKKKRGGKGSPASVRTCTRGTDGPVLLSVVVQVPIISCNTGELGEYLNGHEHDMLLLYY